MDDGEVYGDSKYICNKGPDGLYKQELPYAYTLEPLQTRYGFALTVRGTLLYRNPPKKSQEVKITYSKTMGGVVQATTAVASQMEENSEEFKFEIDLPVQFSSSDTIQVGASLLYKGELFPLDNSPRSIEVSGLFTNEDLLALSKVTISLLTDSESGARYFSDIGRPSVTTHGLINSGNYFFGQELTAQSPLELMSGQQLVFCNHPDSHSAFRAHSSTLGAFAHWPISKRLNPGECNSAEPDIVLNNPGVIRQGRFYNHEQDAFNSSIFVKITSSELISFSVFDYEATLHCAPCHNAGGGRIYIVGDELSAMTNAADIIDRIKSPEGSVSLMPPSAPLSAGTIEKWESFLEGYID